MNGDAMYYGLGILTVENNATGSGFDTVTGKEGNTLDTVTQNDFWNNSGYLKMNPPETVKETLIAENPNPNIETINSGTAVPPAAVTPITKAPVKKQRNQNQYYKWMLLAAVVIIVVLIIKK